MFTLTADLPTPPADWALLAAPSASVCWAIVGFFVILGMLVTLSPSRRTYEVKRRKDES